MSGVEKEMASITKCFLSRRYVRLATCNLDQWAMDFTGNLERIRESIRQAKQMGARYRLGPELEIPGYGCEDHFLETDTYLHSWEVLAVLLKGDDTKDIICDFGMPVLHEGTQYNCRVICCNQKILLIRPKCALANDGNYRETRWFVAWSRGFEVEEHYLPRMIREITGQKKVPFGVAAIATLDTSIGSECCEELWAPQSPHIAMGLAGVEIFTNGSSSHHQLRKLHTRMELMRDATRKSGGVYVYSNQQGCDGGRLYFDGSAMIYVNGEMKAQASQFSMDDVEVVVATIDLQDVRSYRNAIASRGVQAATAPRVHRVEVDFALTGIDTSNKNFAPSITIAPKLLSPMEEIASGPPCWLWDYLRRSGQRGYFLPLSGGADSSSTAALVGIMCQLVIAKIEKERSNNIPDDEIIAIQDVRRVTGIKDYVPADAKDLCGKIFWTCYMAHGKFSSAETRNRAKLLAEALGATHTELEIDPVVEGLMKVFETSTQTFPKMQLDGGSKLEDLALQNIQARSRMVLAYFFAQLSPWAKTGEQRPLLVLGSANVDEALRGYYTKYDCSAADINPIGGIAKKDLKLFLSWCAKEKGWDVLQRVVEAPPTAELGGSGQGQNQTDEEDMGMTYDDLGTYAHLRKILRCGPFSMFQKLCFQWTHLAPQKIAEKVQYFFRMYAINRHKMTTLTPAYHAENYSPEDNRFDLRQFLYRVSWNWQFARIDQAVKAIQEDNTKSEE